MQNEDFLREWEALVFLMEADTQIINTRGKYVTNQQKIIVGKVLLTVNIGKRTFILQ